MRGFIVLFLNCLLLIFAQNIVLAADFLNPPFLPSQEINEKALKEAFNTKDYFKALLITEKLLQKMPSNKVLLTKALECSMAIKDYNKASFYSGKLSELESDSVDLYQDNSDSCSIRRECPNVLRPYEQVVEQSPAPECKFRQENMYMENQTDSQDFEETQEILEPTCNENFLKSLISQGKTRQAYWIVKKHHLEQSPNGLIVLGDMAMLDKNYNCAVKYYRAALELESGNLSLQNKLAESYRMLGYINCPTNIFNEVLQKDPCNLDAKLGLGSLEIDKKNYRKAREIFNDILEQNPDYIPAKIAIAHSYVANDDKMSAIDYLDRIPRTNQTKLIKAKLYYDMDMLSDAKETLQGVSSKEAEALKYNIRRSEAITITPLYSFFFQKLADQFKLDYHKFGTTVSKNINRNTNIFMSYNTIIYSSGGENQQNNVVNEFIGGVYSRPVKDWEYHGTLGVKSFQFGNGAMIITDSWIKHHFNDYFNMKLGFSRNNLEQSYLAAVGLPVNGVFTGRAANNKAYVDIGIKLPHQFYSYLKGSYGAIMAQNLITNQYYEGVVGVGKYFYNNPNNKWLNTFSADVVSYNSSYQYNLLRIYYNSSQYFGGYFSPSYYNATTLNLKAEGDIKKWHLKWGLKFFGGIQNSITPDSTTPAWGISPYITYNLNDNVSFNVVYNQFRYADIERDQFIINAVIRGFKKHAKN